jgi:hypothetical protein
LGGDSLSPPLSGAKMSLLTGGGSSGLGGGAAASSSSSSTTSSEVVPEVVVGPMAGRRPTAGSYRIDIEFEGTFKGRAGPIKGSHPSQ